MPAILEKRDRSRRGTVVAAVISLIGAVIVGFGIPGAALASVAPPGGSHKVNVCHATDSDTNAYVFINVDIASTAFAGHLDHRNNPNKRWKTTGTWVVDGIVTSHSAGDLKPDLIQSYTDSNGVFHQLDGNITEATCAGTEKATPPSVTVEKTNNADGNATYTQSEVASGPNQDVSFQLVIKNTAPFAETITSIVDHYDSADHTISSCTDGGTNVVGTTLAAGDSVTCTFTVTSYSPATGTSKINTVTVNVHGNGQDASDQSSSTVTTPPASGSPGVQVTKTNDANGNGTYSKSEQAPQPGSPVSFQLVITNTSDVDETITSIVDNYGGSKDVISTCTDTTTHNNVVGTSLAKGASVTCTFDIANYAPAAGTSLTNTATVTVTANNTTATGEDTSTVSSPPGPGVSVSKTNDADGNGVFQDSETSPSAGLPVTFQLEITNTTAYDETITSINDNYAGVNHTINSCKDAGGNEILNSTLAAGATVTCSFTILGYSPAAGNSLTNTATVTVTARGATASDSDTSTVSTAMPGTPPPPSSNPGIVVLSIAKTAVPVSGSVVQPGQTIDYTITVKNSGNADAPGVMVVDTLPQHLTVSASSISDNGVLSSAPPSVTWSLGTLGAGATKALTFTATVDQDTPDGTDLVNVATLGNQQSTTTHRVSTGGLALVKTVTTPSGGSGAEYGDTLTYGFTAAATGTLNQTGVVVTDVVPTGTTYVNDSAKCVTAGSSTCTVSYNDATRTITWTLGDMAAGATRGLQFQATIDKPTVAAGESLPAKTITNIGNIKSDQTGVQPSNEVKTDVVEVLGEKVVKPPVVNPPTTQPPAVEPQKLPFTGAQTSLQLGAGGLLLMLGAGLLLATRRRRGAA